MGTPTGGDRFWEADQNPETSKKTEDPRDETGLELRSGLSFWTRKASAGHDLNPEVAVARWCVLVFVKTRVNPHERPT